MRALGNYMMRGSVHAAGVAGTLTVVSWFLLPFAHILSGAPLALVALRRGPVAGIQVMAGCLAFVAVVGWAVGMPAWFVATFPIMVWIPVWLSAMVLRRTESQAAMVLLAGVLGIAFILGMRLLTDDPGAPVRMMVEEVGKGLPPESAVAYRHMLATAAPLFSGLFGAGVASSLVVTMLVARWWQALLFKPGGFRAEFHRMLLPRRVTLLPAAGMVAWLLLDGTLAAAGLDVLVISLSMYLFQGIATVHRTVAGRAWSPAWLALMYGSFVLVPQVVLLFVACLGLADSWMGGARSPVI